jgi:hypothetical protein
MPRTGFVAPRNTRSGQPNSGQPLSRPLRVHAGSSGERWRHRSGLNGLEGAEPSDGERLPTRSKPSKGVALVGMRTSSDLSSDGDDGLHGNPANPMSGTGMQHARSSRCGVNRRSGEIPQGRNENRGWQTAVRTRASARVEWTRVSTSEEGHPTIPREEDLAARGDLLPGPTGNTR